VISVKNNQQLLGSLSKESHKMTPNLEVPFDLSVKAGIGVHSAWDIPGLPQPTHWWG
tara:strand:- start:151 stop:321 length:171 start_codon:yes stop_codon:yes gene_type:complete